MVEPIAKCLVVAAALLGGCVLSPTDDGAVASRLDGIDFNGQAAAAGDLVQIRAWNYQRGAWEPLRELRAGTRGIGRDVKMYGWTTADLLVGGRNWVAPDAACGSGGLARFEVRERNGSSWYTLGTFDAAAKECLYDRIGDGVDFYEAGAGCRSGSQVHLVAPSACVTVPAADATPPTVVFRASDDEQVWETQTGWFGVFDPFVVPTGRPLRLRADAFDAQGPSLVQLDFEIEVHCRSATSGDYLRRSTNRVYGEQLTPTGGSVHGTVGASHDLTRASFANLCLAGDTLRSASVVGVATGFNARDGVSSTPQMSFALTF